MSSNSGLLILNHGNMIESELFDDKIIGVKKYNDGRIYEGEMNINHIPHGKGSLSLENGNIYKGNFIDGKQFGKGKYTCPNYELEGEWFDDKIIGIRKHKTGIIYEGEMNLNYIPHGEGSYIPENGHIYKGNFINGKQFGKGKYTCPNYELEGEWFDDKIIGIRKHKTGRIYEGEMNLNHIPNGEGSADFINGHIIKGNFINGKLLGKCKYTHPNYEVEGEFFEDKIIGIKKYKNGDKYEGNMNRNCNPYGKGIYTCINYELEGEFFEDKIIGIKKYKNGRIYDGHMNIYHINHGEGLFSSKNGHVLKGNYINGVALGKCKYTHPDYELEGEWFKDKVIGIKKQKNGIIYDGYMNLNYIPHGEGSLSSENGHTIKGNFINGKPLGKGKYTCPNYELEGEWFDDKIIGIKKYNNGDKYEGDMNLNHIPNGEGSLSSENGNIFKGNFINGKLLGKGKYYCPNYELEGEWFQDKIIGIKKYKNGGKYEGHINLYHLPHGEGSLIDKNDNIIIGTWNNGKYE